MKLYYSPGACSLSPHIVLHELGLPAQPVLASTKTHRLADGTDYYTVNPKGYVPLLELDDGQRLTEGPVILQYLIDQRPGSGLLAAPGSMERYRQLEWLSFITSELHKSYSVLFNPAMPEEAKAIYRQRLRGRYEYVNQQLEGRSYLMGDAFSAPDAYLFTVTTWAKHVKVDLEGLAHLQSFMARMAGRPAVQAAMRAEGLTK
ncbi:MAG: glutathione transferase GstA [Ideonella sp.]|nr:glutathione transferase GstA [Ideonella sp.]MCC7456659.1 glutathione transferase GstA [Nitrospira sp.]